MNRNVLLTLSLVLIIFATSCGAPQTQPPPAEEADDLAEAFEPGSEEWLDQYSSGVSAIRAGESADPSAARSAASVEPGPAGTSGATVAAKPTGTPRTAAEEAAAAAALRPFDQDELDDILKAAQQHATLMDDRTNVLVEGFLDQGLAFLEAGDIPAANEQFAHAYEIDPTNPAARHLYNTTGALLGDDQASLAAHADSARNLLRARRQQKQLLIDQQLEQGRRALAAGDPETAIRNFEDARNLLRFNPDATGVGRSEGEISAFINSARDELEQQLSRREQELAERAAERQQEFEYAEANRLSLKVEGLLRKANDEFLADEYETAVTTLDEVLRLDPKNREADDLRRIASRSRFEQRTQDVRRDYREQWVKTFDDLEHDSIIPNDLIQFPGAEDWEQIVARGPQTFDYDEQQVPLEDKAVEDRLQEVRIPVDFQQSSLDEVVSNLSQITGVNFLMSPDVEDELPNMPPIDLLDRAAQPVSRILSIILEDLSVPEMAYFVKDGIVRVVLADEARGDYVLQMYDIRDLTFTPTDYRTEDFNLLPSGTDPESFTEGIEEDDPVPLITEDTLLSLITDNIAVDSWDDDPERTINQMPGTLIIRQTADVQEQILSLLSDLRQNTTTLINIQTRFLEVEDSFLEDIAVDFRGLTPDQGTILDDFGEPLAGGVGTPTNPEGIGTSFLSGASYIGSDSNLRGRTQNLFDFMLGETGVLTGAGGLSAEALFLDDTNVNVVLRAVTKYQTSNIVNAPSLTIRSGQRGNIRVISNLSYVRDFEPEIAQNAVISQPEVDVVKEGVVLDVRAVASADLRFITLELRPTVATLVPDENGDVLPEELVSLGTQNGNNVTVQLPELRVQRLRTTATIPDGASLLLGGLKKNVEQDYNSSVPFLSDIPIVSFFFKNQGQYNSMRKLLILLKATVIVPEERAPSLDYLR